MCYNMKPNYRKPEWMLKFLNIRMNEVKHFSIYFLSEIANFKKNPC